MKNNIPQSQASNDQSGHVPWLDGARGIAALWVLVSHVSILSGVRWMPVLSWGATAVDLFMLLSGFLMTHLALTRDREESWQASVTWRRFWIRRLFRIVPLYYLLLVIALMLGPTLGNMREVIGSNWPATVTPASRYFDQSPMNIFAHTMLYFGMDPRYAFNTPLPDWSIGLELQYYALFPAIFLLAMKWGAIRSGLLLIAASVGAMHFFPDYFARFEMPAFLPMKLHVFLIGSWIAFGLRQGKLGRNLAISVVVMAVMCFERFDGQALASVLLVSGMFYLMNDGTLPASALLRPLTKYIRQIFSSAVARFFGDTSYSVYLLHLLVLIPVGGVFADYPEYRALPDMVRFAICFVIAVPPIFLASMLLHKYVERPGIRLGARFTRMVPSRRHTMVAPAEVGVGERP